MIPVKIYDYDEEMIHIPLWKYDELIAIKDQLETVKIIVENESFPRETLALILGVDIKEGRK